MMETHEPGEEKVANIDRARPEGLSQVDALRKTLTLSADRRSELGQFMTPDPIADQMASMFANLPAEVRLLEAGAGIGSLIASFVTHAIRSSSPPKSIYVTAFEIDQQLMEILKGTVAACKAACNAVGIRFEAELVQDDYIIRSAEPLFSAGRKFDVAILNPPYAKIGVSSRWRQALRSLGIETVNLYSAFIAVAINQLEEGGELVAITPRSFCNGPYYEQFRKHLLTSTELLRIRVFESRKKAFKDDDVLQLSCRVSHAPVLLRLTRPENW